MLRFPSVIPSVNWDPGLELRAHSEISGNGHDGVPNARHARPSARRWNRRALPPRPAEAVGSPLLSLRGKPPRFSPTRYSPWLVLARLRPGARSHLVAERAPRAPPVAW